MPAPNGRRLAFRLAFLCMLGPVYLEVARSGLRATLPAVFGMKLSRLPFPFASILDEFKSTHELDIAFLSACGLFLFIGAIWEALMLTILYFDGTHDLDPRTNVAVVREVFRYGGIALLVADAVVIFIGVLHQSMWSAGVFSAVVITALYVVVMVMGATVSAFLKHN